MKRRNNELFKVARLNWNFNIIMYPIRVGEYNLNDLSLRIM